jgi:single-stranded-DNA-specific exonuclease
MNDLDVHLVRARQAVLNAAAVVPHPDADGLAAGAIALRARAEAAGAAVLLDRGLTPFAPEAPLPDGPLALLGWGVRELDRPAVMVDHHLPEVAPRADQIVVSSFGEAPQVPTAALMRRVIPAAPAWLAAVGAVSDLGPAALALPECRDAPLAAVRRLAGLVDGARRVPHGPVRTALALLIEHDEPDAALLDPRIGELEDARRTWKAEYDRLASVTPMIGETTALLRVSTACQVHSLIATTWARRLAPRLVVVANDGYLDGRVDFAVRGGSGLPSRLRRALPGIEGEFAHGGDRASGGSLTPDDFERLLIALGVAGTTPAPEPEPAGTATSA